MTRALADDCFAIDDRMLTAPEAWARLRALARPVVGTETVALADAAGRFLAADVVADRLVPPADNAAVDGYAFRAADLAADGPTRLRLAGRSAAGAPSPAPVEPGSAVRILTGAAVPAGADSVAMQEVVAVDGNSVVLPVGTVPRANVRAAGEDIRPGDAVLSAGALLRPQEIGVAASLGHAHLPVFRRLRVALFSTGDELTDPGGSPPPAGIYDSNRPTLRALLAGFGHAVTDGGRLPDDGAAVRAALAGAARDHDAVLTSGGASAGDADHVVAALRALGDVHAWRIAIKPGRPLAFGSIFREKGRAGEGGTGEGACAFVGLPGNPVSAAVCAMMFARPLFRVLAGGTWPEPRRYPLPAAFAMDKRPGRREWLRARTVQRDGTLRVEKAPAAGSGILTSMTWAEGLVELEEERTDVREGETVAYVPFSELGGA